MDNLLVFLGLQLSTGGLLARDIGEVAYNSSKPVVVNWMAPPAEALSVLRSKGVPVFSDPSPGVKAVAALAQYAERRERYLARLRG